MKTLKVRLLVECHRCGKTVISLSKTGHEEGVIPRHKRLDNGEWCEKEKTK